MADKDKVTTLQARSQIAASKALGRRERTLVPRGQVSRAFKELPGRKAFLVLPSIVIAPVEEVLRGWRRFTVHPRTAISLANKESKDLPYPLPPFGRQNLLLLFRQAQYEWKSLGKHRGLALPVIILVALTTWEKEYQLRQERWEQVEREETARLANELYEKSLVEPEVRRKRRFWPFNRGSKG